MIGRPISATAAAREAVAVLRLPEANVVHHLQPLLRATSVSRLWVVRPEPPPSAERLPGARHIEVRGRPLPLRLWRVYRHALRLARRPEVGWLISFNPVPYGLLALAAGRRAGKPVHVGFVGSDWHRHGRSWYGPALRRSLRGARLLTVPGTTMKRAMTGRGYAAAKIEILPHAIDVDSYAPRPAEARSFDMVFVGRLVALKRVDRLLEAVAEIKRSRPDVRLAVVGDGPERPALERQAAALGLAANVAFVGYQSDPGRWLCDARIVVNASRWEGLPFALVEGMAAGAVPVATAVGSVGELIEDGVSGLLVRPDAGPELTAALLRLLEDPPLYRRLQAAVAARRDSLGYDHAAQLWSEWLGEDLE